MWESLVLAQLTEETHMEKPQMEEVLFIMFFNMRTQTEEIPGNIAGNAYSLIWENSYWTKNSSCILFGKVLTSNHCIWELWNHGEMVAVERFHKQLCFQYYRSRYWRVSENVINVRHEESQNPLTRSPSVGVLIVFSIRGLIWEQILNVICAGRSFILALPLFDRTTEKQTEETHTE